MKLFRYTLFALCLAPGLIACGDDGTTIEEFGGYGAGMPGADSVEGGEVLLEHVELSPIIGGEDTAYKVNQFHAYHFTGAYQGASVFDPFGECYELDFATIENLAPAHIIDAATADYTDFGSTITLSGPGLSQDIAVAKNVAGPDGQVDNRLPDFPRHGEDSILYGGPGWQFDFETGDADAFQEADLVAEGLYTLSVQNDSDEDITFNMAKDLSFSAMNGGVVGTDDILLPAASTVGADGFEITWEPKPNPNTLHGREHNFSFIYFLPFPGEEGAIIGCNPTDQDDPGSITMSKALYDKLPAAGIVQQGRYTHWMDIVDERRFDAFTIWCAISSYALDE